MADWQQIVSQMRNTLAVTDPDLDTTVGTTTRKILDVVGEAIGQAYVDEHLLAYQYDIDSKVDADLDAFCQLFGIARLAAKRGTGTVVFSRSQGSTRATIFIPSNTEIVSNTVPGVAVQTIVGAVLSPGELSVSVPVQAVEAGPDGNLAANTLVVFGDAIEGIGRVTNLSALTGGTNQETDEELRRRWKTTVFRSMAGTESMYLGIALDDPSCYAANVVGASKRRREQIQIVGGEATSTVDDAAYIYASPVTVGKDIDGGEIVLKDHDYSWATTIPPELTVINATALPNTEIFDLEFEYVPKASRNIPGSGITNRVDVWCGGARAAAAQQTIVFQQSKRFVGDTGSVYYRGNFATPIGTNPALNNVFIPLAYGPILTLPDTIVVGATTYGRATPDHAMGTSSGGIEYAYQAVHENSAFGYTPTSLFGLEWSATQLPANGTVFSLGANGGYTYNEMITDIQRGIDRWRLAGIDAKAHAAKVVQLKFSFAIMYDPRAPHDVVNSDIDTAIGEYLTRLGFNGVVQVSDVLQTVHNVPGVDNVRFVNGTDYGISWNPATPNLFQVGIQRYVAGIITESFVDSTGRPKDIRFGDWELPAFALAFKTARAQNNWGSA